MAFHIRDPRADAAVRELAKEKGVSITVAVREAAERELAERRKKLPLMERIKDITDEVASWPKTGLKADKAFYDSLNDEDD
jgi:antitoxin VapB